MAVAESEDLKEKMDQRPQIDRETLEKRPGILMIGSSNVGKRTLLSRLLSVGFEDNLDSSSEVLAQGWTIDTKYYTADITVWMAHLNEGFSLSSLPNFDELAALVMVFDLSELSSLAALKEWVSHSDIQNFDIRVCIGNKVDLIPGHPAHVEYKRRLQRLGDAFVTSDADLAHYGISETEGSSLLGDEEPSWEVSRSCLEWCTERNIEYIEACGSNVDFDKCLSVNGDSQGLERLYGALSAHMWPGMVLKSGNKIIVPSLPERQESSDEESDYEPEYEVLSGGSADLWGDTEWVSGPSAAMETKVEETDQGSGPRSNGSESHPSMSRDNNEEVGPEEVEPGLEGLVKGAHFELEELEQLMSEIANVRSSSRLMPDSQRREMAANLALRMASMFGDDSGDEGFD